MSNNIKMIDILKRDEFINDILEDIKYVSESNGNSFIMINGEWGSGKTFVLNMIKERIENDYNVIEYNCWENSFYPDPLIAIISSLTDQLNEFKDINRLGLEIMQIFGITGNIKIEPDIKFFGIEIIIKNKRKDKGYKSLESYINNFKNELIEFNNKNFSKDNKKTRVVIVDELDRCLPEYAIKVLERLYLLFKGIPNVVILIGNNNNQLETSIKQIFGQSFQLDEYLKKMIDLKFNLDFGEVDTDNFYNKYINYFGLFDFNIFDKVRTFSMIAFLLNSQNIREQEKKIKILIKKHSSLFNKVVTADVCIVELMCEFIPVTEMEYFLKKLSIHPKSIIKRNFWHELELDLKIIDREKYNSEDYNNIGTITKALKIYINLYYDLFELYDITNYFSYKKLPINLPRGFEKFLYK